MGSLWGRTDKPARRAPSVNDSPNDPRHDSSRPYPPVRLRVPTDEDAYAWHRVFAHPDVMEFHGGRPKELSVYEELTARQRRHAAERGFCLWTLVDAEGEVIGFTGAQPWPHESFGPYGEIEIGWRLGRAHWGRGYATAAARATLERVRAAGVEQVVAMVNARNERSIAVTRRLGMRLAKTFTYASKTVPSTELVGHQYELAL
ncbi:GNAT family N-acetyltransferase [Streptomyces bomunensis]|uniref:GNAT family N-acetyltransferase n=1 Tax=Streptomyces montanisoli TaxID=2798581 RepID=A0A940ME24_9ACTN|nr:GNAT family N-acetyltransferase [Streptomyces montanisoli]